MNAVPYLTNKVLSPWTEKDERDYSGCISNYDTVVFIPSIHARLLLVEDNKYLCSIKCNDGLFKNFHLIPFKRSSFYIHAHIPQLSVLYKLYLTNSNIDSIPSNSLFKDLYAHFDDLINNYYSFDEDNDIYIIGDQVLIKVNAPITDWFYRFNPGVYNPEIIEKINLLNSVYNKIVNEYKLLLQNDYIRQQLFIYKAKKFAKRVIIKAITISTLSIGIDFISDWAHIHDINMDYTYDGGLDNTIDTTETGENIIVNDDAALTNLDHDGISFQGGKDEKVLKGTGGSLRTQTVQISKKAGTTHTYEVKQGGKLLDTIKSNSPGTKVKINGIEYKIT